MCVYIQRERERCQVPQRRLGGQGGRRYRLMSQSMITDEHINKQLKNKV